MTMNRKALLITTPHQVRQVPQAPGTDQQNMYPLNVNLDKTHNNDKYKSFC